MTRMLTLRRGLLAIAAISLGGRWATAQTVPTGFTDSLVANVGSPTDLNFLPDGRMLITTQGGTLRVYCPSNSLPGCSTVGAAGGLLPTPALTFTPTQICSNSERGLLGVAVDPSFATNNFIYLYYTFNKFNSCTTGGGGSLPPSTLPVNRVSRFVFNPATNAAGTETVLVDNMLNPGGNHNGGDVDFGKDGKLYITVGDGGCDYAGDSGCQGGNDASRDQNRLEGKILRINPDGSIPTDNPFRGATDDRCNVNGGTVAGHRCQETFSWGHRNPFRFAFDPNAGGTRFYINEVGEGAREEINDGTAGADFGWNCREGKTTNSTTGKCSPTPPNMVDPIFDYPHGTITGTSITGANCITGGAFVPNGVWPAAYNGLYLAADYGAGGIFKMTTAPPYVASNFGSGFGGGSITSMRFGPLQATQALYYTSYAGGGQVRRITATNVPPTAVASSDIPGGSPPPIVVTFSGAGSTDPAGLPLTYQWDFGDGSATATGTPVQHTYTTLGTFTATLRVSNGTLTSAPATVVILIGSTPVGTFRTVTPCRLVDTRNAAGPFGGPALASGATRPFTLINQCQIPAGVKAVAMNVTVVGPTQGGDLRLFPTGGSATASNLNFSAGQTRANNATVKVSASGQVSVTCAMSAAGSTHFLLDVVGYFE